MPQQLNADGSLYDPRQPTAGGNNGNNSTGYEHPQETNLLNVHKAMEYDLAGKPQLRVAAKLSGPTKDGTPAINACGPGPELQLRTQ